MKTLPLQELVRRPAAVRKLTAKGQSVRVTHQGKPLWVLMPDTTPAPQEPVEESDTERAAWLDKFLGQLLAEPRWKGKSAPRMVIEERGQF